MILKESNCIEAANQLGFTGEFSTGEWDYAPPGCFVGHPYDNWTKIFFNKILTGTLGESKYKSICSNKGNINSNSVSRDLSM